MAETILPNEDWALSDYWSQRPRLSPGLETIRQIKGGEYGHFYQTTVSVDARHQLLTYMIRHGIPAIETVAVPEDVL